MRQLASYTTPKIVFAIFAKLLKATSQPFPHGQLFVVVQVHAFELSAAQNEVDQILFEMRLRLFLCDQYLHS